MESDSYLIDPLIYDQKEIDINTLLFKFQMGQIRRNAHMTQQELAKKSKLSIKCIGDIESLKSGNPTLSSMIKYLNSMDYELYACKRKV